MPRRKLRFRLKQKPGEKGIFLPERVLKSLTNATESELKLLILLAKEGRDKDYLSESDLLPEASKAGIDKDTFTEALAFFRGAGLVENEETDEKSFEPKQNLSAVSKKSPTTAYTSEELSRATGDREFLELVEFAGKSFKKPLNRSDIATLYSFTDSLLLPYDVIMLGIEHCVTEGKLSLRYVEKLLIDFADREVNTYEKAEEYIKSRALYKTFEGKIRAKLGIGQRSLTAKEKTMIACWQSEWNTPEELIDLAYEKTVEKTNKASMSYMNKILENWHTAGYKTVEDISCGDKKMSVVDENSSFNPDEFFAIAVSHARKKAKEQNDE